MPQKPQDLTAALNRLASLLPVASAERGYLPTRHGNLDFAHRTLIMGIGNVTPDSFFDGGRRLDPTKAVADGAAMAASGPGPAHRRLRKKKSWPECCRWCVAYAAKSPCRFQSTPTNRASLARRLTLAPTSSMTSARCASIP